MNQLELLTSPRWARILAERLADEFAQPAGESSELIPCITCSGWRDVDPACDQCFDCVMAAAALDDVSIPAWERSMVDASGA